jgi:hypothetical protein
MVNLLRLFSCRENLDIPPDILEILYNDLAPLSQFGIKLPGFIKNDNCFVAPTSVTGCDIKQLQCRGECCSGGISSCGSLYI